MRQLMVCWKSIQHS